MTLYLMGGKVEWVPRRVSVRFGSSGLQVMMSRPVQLCSFQVRTCTLVHVLRAFWCMSKDTPPPRARDAWQARPDQARAPGVPPSDAAFAPLKPVPRADAPTCSPICILGLAAFNIFEFALRISATDAQRAPLRKSGWRERPILGGRGV